MGLFKSIFGGGAEPEDYQIGAVGISDKVQKALAYGDVDDRWNAIRAVGELGGTFVDPLVNALKDDFWIIRRGASDMLGRMGPAAVPPLVAMLAEEDEAVRRETERALILIGEPSIEPLQKALTDENPHIRRGAIEILGLMLAG